MTTFLIDSADFGIDLGDSRFVLADVEGARTVTIEIRGDAECHERITEDEGGAWSWTLYPPYFYLRDFPIAFDAEGMARIVMKADDLDDHDAGIYMMEHGAIDDVELVLTLGQRLEISGRLSLFGEDHRFAINWILR